MRNPITNVIKEERNPFNAIKVNTYLTYMHAKHTTIIGIAYICLVDISIHNLSYLQEIIGQAHKDLNYLLVEREVYLK